MDVTQLDPRLKNKTLSGQFWLQSDFFRKSPPPSDFVPVGDRRGPKILSPPPIKNLEKKTLKPDQMYFGLDQLKAISNFGGHPYSL